LCQAFTTPAAYTTLADIFPPQYRGSANAIFSSGIYLGGGLARWVCSAPAGRMARWIVQLRLCGVPGAAAAGTSARRLILGNALDLQRTTGRVCGRFRFMTPPPQAAAAMARVT
jgi:MFS family permease